MVRQDALAVLERDRAWNGYAIADLDEPFRQYASVSVRDRAALLILRHPDFRAICTHGPAAGVSSLLAEADLPERCHFLVRLSHRAALARHYAVDGHTMLRLYVTRRLLRLPTEKSIVAERLGPDDGAAIAALYQEYDESAYHPDQLGSGVFYGVRDGHGRLLAAGGTHVVSRRYALAAVGNIYTLPEARGRGYARAVTAAVVSTLLGGLVDLVVLNVAPENAAARRVYEGMGFRTRCRYWEGSARR
jgi:ribosomal protein S18 acetylase RimI-like enzyme